MYIPIITSFRSDLSQLATTRRILLGLVDVELEAGIIHGHMP